MESVYQFSKNELINIRQTFDNFKSELDKLYLPENEEDISRAMNFCGSDQDFKDLKDSVDLNIHLDTGNDLRIAKFYPEQLEKFKPRPLINVPKDALKLETANELLKFRENQIGRQNKTKEYPFGKTEFTYKFVKQDFLPISPLDTLVEPYFDVLISIRIYRPFCYIFGKSTYGPSFQEEYIVLGSQYLTDLRDKISCNSNDRSILDISENPDQILPKPDTNPGFFFITDTFYNDTRISKNPDYSECIRNWIKNRPEFSKETFKKDKMEATQFFDLNIRLGYPQVYQHHGNCEHLFTFSSIQIVSPKDHLRKSDYPILRTMSLNQITFCNMCGSRKYSVVVKGSKRQLYDPTFLCRLCFDRFHYIDGKKVDDFKAYILLTNDKIDDIEISDEELTDSEFQNLEEDDE